MLGAAPPHRVYDVELIDVARESRPLDLRDYEAVRSLRTPQAELSSGVEVSDLAVPTGDGRSVPVRAYRPASARGVLPAIVHFHGGGYVAGSLDTSHAHCAALSERVSAVVLSVDYRLAPEHPFPSAVEDGTAVIHWVHRSGRTEGIDADRLAVHGRSAGAGLAARVAIAGRDVGVPVRFQYLNCPQLDPTANDGSMTLEGTAFLDADAVRAAWTHYLGPQGMMDTRLVAAASPMHHADLSGLPSAYVAVMEHDPLRDQGIAYSLRLQASGVPVELHVYPGTFHCSATVAPAAAISVREVDEEVAVLRRGLTSPVAGGLARSGEVVT